MRRARYYIFLLAAFCFAGVSAPAYAEVTVVVSRSIQADNLTLSNLRSIFSMRTRTWPDGSPVRVFVLGDRNDTHREFCRTLLKMYPYVLRDRWDQLLFTGTGQSPTEVSSESELLRHIAATPGAIGYVQKEKAQHENIKILPIR